MAAKFIRHKNLGIIIFSPKINHDKMVKYLDFTKEEIISAGFVSSTLDGLVVGGYSETLMMGYTEEDKTELNKMFFGD